MKENIVCRLYEVGISSTVFYNPYIYIFSLQTSNIIIYKKSQIKVNHAYREWGLYICNISVMHLLVYDYMLASLCMGIDRSVILYNSFELTNLHKALHH